VSGKLGGRNEGDRRREAKKGESDQRQNSSKLDARLAVVAVNRTKSESVRVAQRWSLRGSEGCPTSALGSR